MEEYKTFSKQISKVRTMTSLVKKSYLESLNEKNHRFIQNSFKKQ